MEFGTFSSHWKVDSWFPRRLNWSVSLVKRQALFHWLAWFCGRVRLGCSFAQSQLRCHIRICMVSCSQQGPHSLGGKLFYITPKSILNFNYFVCRPALKKDTSACLKSLKKDWCTIKFSINKKVRTWRCFDDGILSWCIFETLGRILSLSWHSSGDFIVTGSSNAIRVWNVKTGHAVNRLSLGRADSFKVKAFAFHFTFKVLTPFL